MNEQLLYISEPELIEAGGLDMGMCLETVEDTYRLLHRKDYLLGGPSQNEHGIRIVFPESSPFPNMPVAGPDRRFMAMVAYVGGDYNVCGVKWYGSNRKNLERGIPRSNHLVVLNDVDTGLPICIMVGNLVSAMRTGAVPSVAAKYLSRPGSETVGLVGAGVINHSTLMGMVKALPNLKLVKVYDILRDKAEAFAAEMTAQTGVQVIAVDSLEAVVRDSDVVHIAASGKIPPFLKTEWLRENILIEMSAGCKFEDGFMNNCNIVMDNYAMHDVWLDTDSSIDIPSFEVVRGVRAGVFKREDIIELPAVIDGGEQSRIKRDRPIIFHAQGMPIYDVAFGYRIYQNAMKQSICTSLPLWVNPHWA